MSDIRTSIIGADLYSSTCQTDDWQPIETAPKDGTKVDLWVTYGEGKTKGERWPDAWFGEYKSNFGFEDEDSTLCWQDDVCPVGNPGSITHWRSIPKGPGE